jgi:hypothetical protein
MAATANYSALLAMLGDQSTVRHSAQRGRSTTANNDCSMTPTFKIQFHGYFSLPIKFEIAFRTSRRNPPMDKENRTKSRHQKGMSVGIKLIFDTIFWPLSSKKRERIVIDI